MILVKIRAFDIEIFLMQVDHRILCKGITVEKSSMYSDQMLMNYDLVGKKQF